MSENQLQLPKFRLSLGNKRIFSNQQIQSNRKSFYINSTRNSEDTPEWMRSTSQHYRRKGLHRDEQSFFNVVRTSNVYEKEQRDANSGGQFHLIKRRRPRNMWELKDQTFHFQWPKKEEELNKPQEVRTSRFMSSSGPRYITPKYALTLKSPLYRQQPTVVKIGHNSLINSTYVK